MGIKLLTNTNMVYIIFVEGNMKNLGFRIKKLREARMISVEKLSDDTGVSSLIIHACECGRTEMMSIVLLIKIARYFGVTTDYLLGL